jgi:preprotein translocase subunit SecY
MRNILEHIWTVKDLRSKILFILGVLVCYRILANIPLPGVDVVALKQLFEGNELLNLLNIFSGGGLSNISLVLLGVGPYITASIIMQLLTTWCQVLIACTKKKGSKDDKSST